MKTTLQFLNLNIHSSWYHILEQQVDSWQRVNRVQAIEVLLERQTQGRPGFRVRVHLTLGGEDIHAEVTARTLKTALLTASKNIETQINAHKLQRLEGRAANRHPARPGEFIFEPVAL